MVPYRFEVSNPGNVVLTGITVTDPTCDAAPVFESGDTDGDGGLDVGETWVYTCTHTVTQAEIDATAVATGISTNTVTADSDRDGAGHRHLDDPDRAGARR